MSAGNKRRRSRVSFGSVQVREFDVIAGDHPGVTEGPSLSLGWGYVEHRAQSVRRYENGRDRASKLMPLNVETRKFILSFVFDISPVDIKRSEKIAEHVQSQRQETRDLQKQQQQKKKKYTKKKIGIVKKSTPETEEAPVGLIEDPLPRHGKHAPSKSFFKHVARKRFLAYKYMERRA